MGIATAVLVSYALTLKHSSATTSLPTAAEGPVVHVTANALYAEYQVNVVRADTKYQQRRLDIAGEVQVIDRESEGTYLVLRTGNADKGVAALFEHESDLVDLNPGDRVVVHCIGGGASNGQPVAVRCAR